MFAIATSSLAYATAEPVVLATFDGSKTAHSWQVMNDPVMGGQSHSSFAQEGGVGNFTGLCAIVPFLKAPGFCKIGTTHGLLSPPGFADASAMDFRPAPGSALIGLADASVSGAPDREYAEDEAITRRFRFRLAAGDVGAFESGAPGDALGPYDEATPPTPGEDAGPADRDAGPRADASTPSSDASASPDAGPGAEPDGGCGCRVGATRPGAAWPLISLLLAALVITRRR